MNKVIIVGNLVKDIEMKETLTGKKVIDFTLAVNEGKVTEFIDCQAWDKSAELVHTYVSKGQKLLVEGKLRTVSYEGKTGKVKKTFILVDRTEFLSAKPSSESHKNGSYVEIKDEDLPFF